MNSTTMSTTIPHTIKAVIFDWGGVLIDAPKRPIIRFVSQYFNEDEKRVEELVMRHLPPFQTGTVSEQTFWRRICTDLNTAPPASPSLWYEAFSAAYREQEATFTAIDRLKKAGYRIGFLSNTEFPARRFFYEQQYDCFDAEIFSCVEGVAKPDRAIYLTAAAKLGVRPEACLFVDDKEENIRGARAAGMAGLLFRDQDLFQRELWDTLTG